MINIDELIKESLKKNENVEKAKEKAAEKRAEEAKKEKQEELPAWIEPSSIESTSEFEPMNDDDEIPF